MFDIKLIREEPEFFDTALKRRKLEPQSSTLIEVDRKRREKETEAQLLQTRRNELSNEIGKLKAAGEDASQAIKEVANSKEKQAAAEEGAKLASEELNRLMAGIPNIPLPDVPDGLDAEDNVENDLNPPAITDHFPPEGTVFSGSGNIQIAALLVDDVDIDPDSNDIRGRA